MELRRGPRSRARIGRPTSTSDPGADLVAYLRQAGFRALLVDRFGYTDGGQALEARLAGAATRRADSPDGRFAWYELG